MPLAIASWLLEQPILLEGAFLAVVINGLNLLPILPLDGGWVANTLVFSRHYLLSIAFYLVAICLLFLASAAIQDRILMGLGIAMLVGIRWVYQKGKIARDLTKSGFAAVSTDDQTIPQDVALEIIRRVRAAFPRGLTPKQTANLTLQVFETLNARPPGWLATIGLFFVYVGSLISALLLAGVLALFQHGDPQAFMAKLGAAASADTPIACGSVERWDGAEAGTLAADANVIVANFPDVAEAKSQFAELQSQLPPAASATLFGQTLLIALPGADNANRERLLGELSAHSQEVFVNNAEFLGWMQLTCVAPNGAVAEEIVAVADEYFRSGDGAFLIPPWSSEFEITPEHRKARQTYLAIVDSAGFYDDKRVEALAEQVQRAMRAGDSAGVKRLTKEQSELVKRLQEEQLSRIEQDQKYDPRVVAHYRSMPRFPEENWDELEDEGVELDKDLEQQYATWSRELGPLLGQLPMNGGKLTSAAAEVAADGGSINSLGPLVTFRFLSMKRIDRGAPALVDWLCGRGCSDVKYSLTSAGMFFDE